MDTSFKEIKRLKSLQKAELYLEHKQASMMKLFLRIYLMAIFALKAPS